MGKRKKKRKQTSGNREAVKTIRKKTFKEMNFKEKAGFVAKTVGNALKASANKVAHFFRDVVWEKGLKVAGKAIASFFRNLFGKIKEKKPMLGLPSAEYRAVLKRFPGVTSIRELSILAKNSAAGADEAYLEMQQLNAELDEINNRIASLRTPKDADEKTASKLADERAALRDERDSKSKRLLITESKGRSLEVAADEYAYLLKLFTGKENNFRDTERFAPVKIDITKEEAMLLIRALEAGERREAKKNLKSSTSEVKEEKMENKNFFKDKIWEKGIKAAGLAVAAFATKKAWPGIKKGVFAVRDFFKNVVWGKGLKVAFTAVKTKTGPGLKKAGIAVRNFFVNIIWKKGLKKAIVVVSSFCTNVIWLKGLKVAYLAVVAFSMRKFIPFIKNNYKKWWFITACVVIVAAVVCAIAIPAANQKKAEASAYDVKVVEPPKTSKAIVEEAQAAAEESVAKAEEAAAATKAAADESVAKAKEAAAATKAAADESVAKAKEAAAATKAAAEESVSKASTAAEKAIAQAKEEAAAVKAAAEKAVEKAKEEAAAVKAAAEESVAKAKEEAAAVKAAADKSVAAAEKTVADVKAEIKSVKADAESAVAKAEKEAAAVKAAAEKSVEKAEKEAAAVKAAADKTVAAAKEQIAAAKSSAEKSVAEAEAKADAAIKEAQKQAALNTSRASEIVDAAEKAQAEAEEKAEKLEAENTELSDKNALLNSKLYALQKADEEEAALYAGKLNSLSVSAVPYVITGTTGTNNYTNMLTVGYNRTFAEKFNAGAEVSFFNGDDDKVDVEALATAGYTFNLKNDAKFSFDMGFGLDFTSKKPVLSLDGQFILPENSKSNFSVGVGAGFEYDFSNDWRVVPFELSINYKF